MNVSQRTKPLIRRLEKNAIAEIFRRFAQAAQAPSTELHYQTPYQLLVAVILSAQSTDKGVNKVTPSLFAIAPDAESMVKLGEKELTPYLKSLGLYRAKARHIAAMSKKLLADFQGEVPASREALESLPGVGRKTANVILNTLYGHPVIAVDTHVFRVARRLGLSAGATVLAVEEDLMKRVPPAYLTHAHHWLILHGRYQCTARAPQCATCLVENLCKKNLL